MAWSASPLKRSWDLLIFDNLLSLVCSIMLRLESPFLSLLFILLLLSSRVLLNRPPQMPCVCILLNLLPLLFWLLSLLLSLNKFDLSTLFLRGAFIVGFEVLLTALSFEFELRALEASFIFTLVLFLDSGRSSIEVFLWFFKSSRLLFRRS